MIAEIGENPHVHKELLRNTVEIVTGICENVRAGDGRPARHAACPARRIVRDRGMELFCAGTHPFAEWSAAAAHRRPRYAELIKRTQWWGRQMLIWGVHVHVGVSSAHKVMPIITSLLNQYPHLLALSASSPYWDGEDTGYASNRAMMFQQLPTAGLPFHFQEWAQFEGFVHDQKKTGIIDHMNEIRWDIRPSPHLGTVEVRIFDGVSNLRELGALVALTHCLIVDLDRRLDAGEQLPTMPPWHVQENKWRAARYGLDADDHPGRRQQRAAGHRGSRRPAEPARAGGEVAGLRGRTGRGVRTSTERGASYQRQRRVAEEHDGDLRAVVDALVGELGRSRARRCRCSRSRWRCCPVRNCRCGSSNRATPRWSPTACAGDPAFGVVLIAAGREVGGGDRRSDVGALAHIVEYADLGDGRYRLQLRMRGADPGDSSGSTTIRIRGRPSSRGPTRRARR